MRLIADARKAWRYYSTQALVLLAALPAAWVAMPQDVQDILPPEWRPWVLAVIAIGGLAGRFVDQGGDE